MLRVFAAPGTELRHLNFALYQLFIFARVKIHPFTGLAAQFD